MASEGREAEGAGGHLAAGGFGFEHGLDGADVAGVGEEEPDESVVALAAGEGDVGVGDLVHLAVANESGYHHSEAQGGVSDLALAGDAVGVLGAVGDACGGEHEGGLGVLDGHGALGVGEVSALGDGLGEQELDGALMDGAAWEYELIVGVLDGQEVAEPDHLVADGAEAVVDAVGAAEAPDGEDPFLYV